MSITCTNQLSASGGTYNLRFSRIPSTPSTAASDSQLPFSSSSTSSSRAYNPHTDAEAFFQTLLRQGKLGATLPSLVSILRDTVPVVEVLEEIRAEVDQTDPDAMDVDTSHDANGKSKDMGDGTRRLIDVDTFAKAAGWWRLSFVRITAEGTRVRHGLDVRLMRNGRVCILDASHSLFVATSSTSSSPSASESGLLLQPIPDLRQILVEALKELRTQESTMIEGKVAVVDVGIVCGIGVVKGIGRRVWSGIAQTLKQVSSSASTTTFTTTS